MGKTCNRFKVIFRRRKSWIVQIYMLIWFICEKREREKRDGKENWHVAWLHAIATALGSTSSKKYINQKCFCFLGSQFSFDFFSSRNFLLCSLQIWDPTRTDTDNVRKVVRVLSWADVSCEKNPSTQKCHSALHFGSSGLQIALKYLYQFFHIFRLWRCFCISVSYSPSELKTMESRPNAITC